MKRLIEIRTYRLKPDTLDAFHEAMHERAVPMLRSKGMDVVTYGKSDHEEATYHLVRAYDSREALEAEQAAFYGSSEWRDGPRSALVDHIETYLNTLLWVSLEGIDSMRALDGTP
ncbi:quinol monooxygenase YgiN [Variovorax boronicumulans]|uniref:putative quinol monooxygenase n=1 Tax=Variovorax TaxID=34072 RepID=UPI00277E2F57|nr:MULTISPECIES: NIPSNAP family protein [Variovorax]MDQ0037975.1 quinol monooxygenase YgiN [Variovorax boronicumulans]MDQ0041690.1 quinol monooxygenase YgiN [Variovorax boronicumulans]MDQ0610050.1 quinol monooxygenase YgiN [Variovorax sp. W1I1]